MLPNWLNAGASFNQRYFPFKQIKKCLFLHILKRKLDYFSQIAQTFFSSKWKNGQIADFLIGSS